MAIASDVDESSLDDAQGGLTPCSCTGSVGPTRDGMALAEPRVHDPRCRTMTTFDHLADQLVRPSIYYELLQALKEHGEHGILLIGPAGSGKTTLLYLLQKDLAADGRAVFYLPLRDAREDMDLAALVLGRVAESPHGAAIGRSLEIRRSRSVGHNARRAPFWPVSGDQFISGDRSDGRRTAPRASLMRLSITDPRS